MRVNVVKTQHYAQCAKMRHTNITSNIL